MGNKKYIIYMVDKTNHKVVRVGSEKSLKSLKKFLKEYYSVKIKKFDKNWYHSVGVGAYDFNVRVERG